MAPYHILKVIISSVIPENLVLLTKREQSGPKSAHIRPTNCYEVESIDSCQTTASADHHHLTVSWAQLSAH